VAIHSGAIFVHLVDVRRLVAPVERSYDRGLAASFNLFTRRGLILIMSEFVCGTCDKEHGSLPMDLAYRKPLDSAGRTPGRSSTCGQEITRW
jgi:hypothetical protein